MTSEGKLAKLYMEIVNHESGSLFTIGHCVARLASI